MLGRSFGH